MIWLIGLSVSCAVCWAGFLLGIASERRRARKQQKEPKKKRVYTVEDAQAFAKVDPCLHCGGFHLRTCARLKKLRFEMDDDKNIIPVEAEYWPWSRWPKKNVVWPEDLPDIPELFPEDETGGYKPPSIEGVVINR